MADTPNIKRYSSPDALADQVAASLVGSIARLQGLGRVPSIVLTGGSIARKVHRCVAESSESGLVDWSSVEVWFGDERFVPAGDSDRNAGQAAEDLLDRLPFDPARVHVMAPSDGRYGDDPRSEEHT